jgi:glycosyltransferase involved in cell wall biosynthesis
MTVSVVVPTYRRTDHLTRCLDALEQQTRPADEVIVVVREDDLGTRQVLADRMASRHVSIVTVSDPGMIRALNAGLERATGDVIAFTDDDSAPSRDWLRRIVAHFDERPRVGAVGGRDLLPGPPEVVDRYTPLVGRILWYGRHLGNHHLRSDAQMVQTLKGVNMAFRRQAIQGFDIALRGRGTVMGSEIGVCLAARSDGWGVLFDPAITVVHAAAPRFGESREDLRSVLDWAHNETYAMLRHLPPGMKVVAFVYGLAIGTRGSPGPVLLAERLVRGTDRVAVVRLFLAATMGRLLALSTYVRSATARRAERAARGRVHPAG